MIRYEADDTVTPVATWAADGDHPPVPNRWAIEEGDPTTMVAKRAGPCGSTTGQRFRGRWPRSSATSSVSAPRSVARSSWKVAGGAHWPCTRGSPVRSRRTPRRAFTTSPSRRHRDLERPDARGDAAPRGRAGRAAARGDAGRARVAARRDLRRGRGGGGATPGRRGDQDRSLRGGGHREVAASWGEPDAAIPVGTH